MIHREVSAVLESMGLPVNCNALGFVLSPTARIENGSGIAGRGGHWRIVRRIEEGFRSGDWVSTESVTSKPELRRLLREYMTHAPKPPARKGFVHYAKLNHNRFGEAYVWVTRSKP